ncbi:hypothetical protein WL22_06170 [Burkholderia ubonensis]|nr:hypothetical protein [Burkholderia ubonensis]KVN82525.1 hypothetical protein WJ67_00395 [Burkholderia ubonensis]KVO32104.1 hypothetical protein WJ75_23505 [Burkholderia ubonensis]KVZ77155.1 hypothetical protein WL22_06170 [Burkholderia ubonensis]KWD51719.1 hypothetical protein WL67_01585 [Burkholderia ubonensis]KWD56150.1 hypothetical protein WL66_10370 [Burkholderia ubonensis]
MNRAWRWVPGMLAMLCCTGSMAAGVLKLSHTEMTLAPDRPAGELVVENTGDTPLYLNVEQDLVANPGETPERLVSVADVAAPGLLVLPNRLVVAPGQRYRMIVKELGTPSQSQVWRVTFRQKTQIAVGASPHDAAPAPIFVNLGYGVVIYQLGADRLSK